METIKVQNLKTSDLLVITDPSSPLYDPTSLKDLDKDFVNDIASNGILQNVVVVKTKTGKYAVVAGRSRVRAAQEVGIKEVPAQIIGDEAKLEDHDLVSVAIRENSLRKSQSQIEKARWVRRYIEALPDDGVDEKDQPVKLDKQLMAAEIAGVTKKQIQNWLYWAAASPKLHKVAEAKNPKLSEAALIEVALMDKVSPGMDEEEVAEQWAKHDKKLEKLLAKADAGKKVSQKSVKEDLGVAPKKSKKASVEDEEDDSAVQVMAEESTTKVVKPLGERCITIAELKELSTNTQVPRDIRDIFVFLAGTMPAPQRKSFLKKEENGWLADYIEG